MERVAWSGTIVSVQPRIRFTRSFDERGHSYLGYSLRIAGMVGGEPREFSVGVGKAAHEKHKFQVGDQVRGESLPVADERLEDVELYRTTRIAVVGRFAGESASPPPWHGVPPSLDEYRARGDRRLAAQTYAQRCRTCIWGCCMPVVIIVDHWRPEQKRYRFETFCYGPKSCRLYAAGPTRKVPGRRGMTWEEPDWLYEQATAHRGPDE